MDNKEIKEIENWLCDNNTIRRLGDCPSFASFRRIIKTKFQSLQSNSVTDEQEEKDRGITITYASKEKELSVEEFKRVFDEYEDTLSYRWSKFREDVFSLLTDYKKQLK
jgi:hypothetical protein